jgi:dTDP-4-amino-4,6-dideoxygalactose transaminase
MANSQISLFKVFMSPDVPSILTPILQSGFVTQGKQVDAFEKELQSFFNHPYILTLNSATSGLTMALRMLNLQPQDEVISTALTCTATNWPILANGLNIKWADVDPNTCNISIENIRNALTEKTKAIMVVHWGGYPVDLDGLKEVQDYAESKFGFRPRIIEDCAHAFGATYNGSFVGTTGNIAVFSLQAIKHLTCGDGGLIFLPSQEEYDRAKLLRWYGIDRDRRSGGDFRLESDVSEWGYKYHMNDINATIGLANLPHIAENLRILRDNANYYRSRLENIQNVELLNEDPRHQSARWLFTLKIANKYGFIQFAKDRGIMVSQVHNRNDKHTCVSEFTTSLPNVDILEKNIVCIPVGWWLSEEEKNHVLSTVIEWSEKTSITFEKLTMDNLQIEDHAKQVDEFLSLMKQLNGYNYDLTKDEFIIKFNDIVKSLSTIIIGKMDNKLVCTGRLTIEPKFGKPVGHIEDIIVDENFRGQGVATKLVNYLVNIGKNADCYKIVLGSKYSIARLYEKCGFFSEGSQMVVR